MKTVTQEGPYLQLFRQMCWEIDRDIVTPVQQGQVPSKEVLEKWFLRYGEWDKAITEVSNCLEDEEYYSSQVYELEQDKQEAESDVSDLKDGVQDAIDRLERINEDDADKVSIEATLVEVIRDLNKLV